MIWIVNPFDNLPSEGTRPQRYWLMAQAFVRAGRRVVYWTSDFSHATKRRRVRTASGEGDGGRIEVVQIPTRPYRTNVCWARVRSHARLARDFARLAKARLLAASAAPALIVASAPPLGLATAAMRVAAACGARFVCDIQDAWPETFERILPRWVWSVLGVRRAARRLYCGADGVSAVARRYLELATARGSSAPQHLAGHAIDARPGVRVPRGNGPLRLVYAGNMSRSYDLETVIRAMRNLPDVTLDVAGNGPDRARLEALAARLSAAGACGGVRFHGYLGAEELSGLLRRCDAGIVPMFPESCVGVPGKLADYAAAGLRVVESLGGECRATVERLGAGVHYGAGDVSSFADAVRRLAALPDDAFDARAFAATFDARRIMDGYVAWCGEVMA